MYIIFFLFFALNTCTRCCEFQINQLKLVFEEVVFEERGNTSVQYLARKGNGWGKSESGQKWPQEIQGNLTNFWEARVKFPHAANRFSHKVTAFRVMVL